jgi:hypothetical protein
VFGEEMGYSVDVESDEGYEEDHDKADSDFGRGLYVSCEWTAAGRGVVMSGSKRTHR